VYGELNAMDNDERDGPSAEHWRGEQLAVEELAPRLADEDPEVTLFAVGHLLGMLLSFFPAGGHREGAGKAVLLHAETTATRLLAEREEDLVRAAYIRRDVAQRELEEVLNQRSEDWMAGHKNL
jgi:hypothetical protein